MEYRFIDRRHRLGLPHREGSEVPSYLQFFVRPCCERQCGQTGDDFEFLKNGTLDVYGLGGTLMLDYEHYRDKNEIDIELRYTNITLQSFSDAPAAVQGSSVAQSLSLWTRWRAPTNFTALNKPVRYVLEAARTSYFGDMRGALGFDYLNSVGVGLELDSSAHEVIVTRTRLILRYQFGNNVQGTSVGFAISF